ncbi:hypothetical protein BKA70DRAFT_1267353 [Coprinopsis sp. MPI-PUGE-AT-0042]|nr:hypothetical protein BKA70DRAFT_1267353 [Coprinopsis sp. MPI-PUGE-AT-0042]
MDPEIPSPHILNLHSTLAEPPGLHHYIHTNDVLPEQLVPVLDQYLTRVSERLDWLENDNLEPEGLSSTINERTALISAVGAYTRIKASVRRVPIEVWGTIFWYAVWDPYDKFVDVCRLRGVCRSWRHAALTTPGLWTHLTIDLNKWYCSGPPHERSQTRIERRLAPWLAILTRTPPYHLKLTSVDHYFPTATSPHLQMVHHLLSATPTPGTLTLGSGTALIGALSVSTACASVEKLTISASTKGCQMDHLEKVFPHLRTLCTCRCIDPTAPNQLFPHASLRTLCLASSNPQPGTLARLIQGLPALQELRMATSLVRHPEDNPVDVCPLYTHRALKTLILSGEELLFTACRYICFPSLRFMGIYGSGVRVNDALVAGQIIPRILATKSSRDFTVSLRSHFYQPFLAKIVRSLPPNSNLHLAIDGISSQDVSGWSLIPVEPPSIRAIYCQGKSGSLRWLREETRQRSKPAVIYVPEGAMVLKTIEQRRQQLLSIGYNLQLCSD